MDDVNRFARELADAIAAAAADHPKVEACRERARAAGYEMRVTLEAIVGFASRDKNAPPVPRGNARVTPAQNLEITSNDRRFLRSLRIAADETKEEVDN
jgi:hypothetical protein